MSGWISGAGSANVTSRSRPPARMRPTPLAFARRNHGLFAPCAERTYSSSSTRTTQIVTYGRSVPSGRSEASCNSLASPMLPSSSSVHAFIGVTSRHGFSVGDSNHHTNPGRPPRRTRRQRRVPEINPVARLWSVRLPGVVGRCDVGVHRGLPERRDVAGSRLPNRLHDAVVAGAAAEVARKADPDLVVGWVGVRAEQGRRGDEHPGGTEAALHAELLEER